MVVRAMALSIRPNSDGRTFIQGLLSLAGAVGIALLVPFVILLVGLPVALAVRGTGEAISRLLARLRIGTLGRGAFHRRL